jgi:hypothetical protein
MVERRRAWLRVGMLGGGRGGLVDYLLLGWAEQLVAEVAGVVVLDRASPGWRGLTITPKGLRLLQDYAASSSTRPCQRRWSTRPSPLRRTITVTLRPEPLHRS